ncbi:MAG: hypothetical protein M5U34_31405 [Chloroflexi bacterium]|nr:hypothetical protein [Chloroflexota bacterium]
MQVITPGAQRLRPPVLLTNCLAMSAKQPKLAGPFYAWKAAVALWKFLWAMRRGRLWSSSGATILDRIPNKVALGKWGRG